MVDDVVAKSQADSGWDTYQERVLRNEGRLAGLERLVEETRESDRKLIEQRSESLAQELERRAENLLELVTARANAVLNLGKEERKSDRREFHVHLKLLREMYDTAIRDQKTNTDKALLKNLEQSQGAIAELDIRSRAATEKVEQMVRQWRDSDREARELFATELNKHLDALNHNNERMAEFQAHSVTRELWQAEKDAAIQREGLLRDQIISLDRTMLTMVPSSVADRAHAEMVARMDAAVRAASEVLDNKIGVVSDKVAELKSYTDTGKGKSAGYTNFWGVGVAAITVVIAVILMANTFLN